MSGTTARNCLYLAVAAISAALVAPALAQVPASGQDGRAADGNTRVGSGGFNDRVGGGAYGNINPNAIIYGNVTGGRQFTGIIGERDPRAFSGPISGGGFDRFISGSSAAPTPYQPSLSLNTPQTFYGASRGVAPPIGSEREGFTGTFVGTDLTPQSTLAFSSVFSSAALDLQAQPLGRTGVLGNPVAQLGMGYGFQQPADLILQGSLESSNQQVMYSGSPLYGVRQFQSAYPSSDLNAPAGTVDQQLGGPAANDRFRLPNADLQRMRNELTGQPNGNNGVPSNPADLNNAQQPGQQQQQQPGLDRDLTQPPESPENAALQRRRDASLNRDMLDANTAIFGQEQHRYTRSTPQQQQQSAQFEEMQRRFARFESPQMQAIEQNHQARLNQIQAQQAPRGNAPGPTSRPASTIRPMGQDATLKQTGSSTINLPQGGTQVQPMRVNSLATGVQAKGLHDLLASAEQLMRQDKFQSAIDKYDMAERVAPHEAVVQLGRANAELGAGFYVQASNDLHRVFSGNQALLMARYELSAWMTPQRIQFITKELERLSSSDPTSEMPPFLLAYIAYNIGKVDEASGFLADAQRRAGGQDPLLRVLQARWNLRQPGAAPGDATPPNAAPDLNK